MEKKQETKEKKKKETKIKKKESNKKRNKNDNIPFFKTSDTLGLVVITCVVSLFMGYFFGTKIIAKQVDQE